MFSRNEFVAAVYRRGLKIKDIAKAMEIDKATLYRKMNGTSDFTRAEIIKFCEVTDCSRDEMNNIFFAV